MGKLSIFSENGALLYTLEHVKKGKSMWTFLQDEKEIDVRYHSAIYEEYRPDAKQYEADKLCHMNLFFYDEHIAHDVAGYYFDCGGHSSPVLSVQNETDPGVWRFEFMGKWTGHIAYIKQPLS